MLVHEAIARIDLALGTNGGGAHGTYRVLNEVCAHFFASRAWAFAKSMRGRANLVAGQTHVKLPIGCGQIVAIERTPAWAGSIQIVDAATLQAMKALEHTFSDLTFFAAEEYTTVEGRPVLRLALDHAPSGTTVGAFIVAFAVDWTPLGGDVGQNDILPLPAYAEPYFAALLEAYALGLERPHEGSVSARVAEVDAGPLRAVAVDRDERAVVAFGPSRHTAVQVARGATGEIRESSTINLIT